MSNSTTNTKKLTKHNKKEWYQLDLSAIVYPTLQRKDFSSVYRLSVILKEPVNPDILQQAVDITLKRFPTYKTAIHKGLFWRYLEPNTKPGPFVQPDIRNFCMPMPFRSNDGYLIRVYYHNCRIALEVHHSLGDGLGAMCVLNTLTAVYLRLLGHEISNGYFVMDINETPTPEEWEDAYKRYAHADVCPPVRRDKAYRIRGTKEPFYTLNIINGIIPVSQIKQVSKKYNCTITEYLNAVLLYALLEKQKADNPHRLKPVKLAMPINLRQFFPSKTLRNFITMIYPGIDPRLGDYTFEEIVSQTHHYMRYYINNKFLRGDITSNLALQQHPLVRITPLFIKDAFVKFFYTQVQDQNSSAGLTNLGVLKVPTDMAPFIERFDVYMGQPFSNRTNCAIVSFGNTLTVNFASSIVEADVERYFFRKLVQDGIHVKIETNRSYYPEKEEIK